MNISQKQAILDAVQNILDFDFDQFIAENNPSGNVDEIKFGEDTPSEFKSKYQRTFSQLKAELENGLQLFLPNQETFNNEFNSVTLDSETIHFNQYLRIFGSRNDAAEILKRFIYYQIRQGFWDKSRVKQHNVDSVKLSETQNELLITQRNLDQNIEKFDALQQQIDTMIQSFESISKKSATDSSAINDLLADAQNTIATINTLYLSANDETTEIKASGVSTKQQVIQVNANITEYEEAFTKIKNDNKALALSLATKSEAATDAMAQANASNDYIQSQKEEIIRLVGMAADGSLGYKFDSRKVDLEKGIKYFWRWAVPISIIAALIWVFLVFSHHNLTANLGNPWVNLIVNVIKTAPAWILVGFVFTQYGKERTLQEEYAFKSAIAMTLTAYAEMLSADDGGETATKSSKQEMLLKSIENLYAQPISHHEKQDKSELLSPKQLLESLKSISEVTKNIKG